MPDNPTRDNEFESAAGQRQGLVAEFWEYLKHTKKWWLLPILLTILILGLLVILGGTGAAPFIYTIF